MTDPARLGVSPRPSPHAAADADAAPAEDDSVLVERIRDGDREALGILYDRYSSLAMAAAVRLLRDRDAAEDLVHDVFVSVWQKIGRFDASRASIRTWILAVLRNRAIDRLRSASTRLAAGEPQETDAMTDPGHTWDAVERRLSATELRTAIDRLPDEQREAIELAYFRGRTYREIAEITGVPQGTASGRLRLALQKLREALAWTDAAPIAVEVEAEPASAFRVNREDVR